MLYDDDYYMQLAIDLAKQGMGHTAPNPMVGCVFVKHNEIIAKGFHELFGGYHAERNAVANKQQILKGATAYVSLEPCSHFGKQPPCVDLLIAEQVARVVIPFVDPDSNVGGRSIKKLIAHGIEVTIGVKTEEAFSINASFLKHRLLGLPYVSAKWAMSLDGKIASRTFDSKWISNELSREKGHMLRHAHQAIMIGAGCLKYDNPRLNTRVTGLKNPADAIKVVIAGNSAIDVHANVFASSDTILITKDSYAHDIPKNCKHIVVSCQQHEQIDAKQILLVLAKENIISVLIEGGGELLAKFLQEDLVDSYHIFIAPKLIGGKSAPSPFGGNGFEKISEESQLIMTNIENLNGDCYIQATSKEYLHWQKQAIQSLQSRGKSCLQA